MDGSRWRSLPWPELILGACLVLVVTIGVWGQSRSQCHAWKHKLNNTAGVLTASFAEHTSTGEFPRSRAALRREAREVLDERPFGCF
jgi:hypothetical protein